MSTTLTQEPAAPRTDPLVDALGEFYRAFQKAAIYPSGHPAVPLAVAEATERLDRVLVGRPRLLLGVCRDELRLDNAPLDQAGARLRPLARLFHELDLAAVEFHAGLLAADLEGFLRCLSDARREHWRGVALGDALRSLGIVRVEVCPVDYRVLQFADGIDSAEGERSTDPWEDLTRLLTDPAAHAHASILSRLADDIDAYISCREGAGVGLLRDRVSRALAGIEASDAAGRGVLRTRLAAFVAGLNPELRRDLLRVDAASPQGATALLDELAGVLPMGELLEALRGVDRAGGRVPHEMVLLLGKLSRIAEARGEPLPDLDATLERWGAATVVGDRALEPAFAEVLQRRTDVDFNPETYRNLLGALSRDSLGGAAPENARHYRDPTDGQDVRVHAAEIAVHLLERADGEEGRPRLLAYLDPATDLLLDQRRFDVVLAATTAARAHAVLRTSNEPTRRASRAFLDEFARDERIERILARACEGEDHRVPEEALGLLDLGGALAIDLALESLGNDPPPPVAAALTRLVRRQPTALLEQAFRERAERGRGALEPLFAVARWLSAAQALPLLETICRHDDPRVRREAMSLLCELDDRPGSTERYLQRALGDPDPRLVATAVGRLIAQDGPEACELLGRFLEGRLRDTARTAATCRRVVRGLLGRPAAGRERLARALRFLTRSLTAADARAARLVVGQLGPAVRDPELRNSVRYWRLSLNRLLGVLLGRARRR